MTDQFPDPLLVIVELAFGADPDGDHTLWEWVDVSALVKTLSGIGLRRGRSSEEQNMSSQSARLVLDNDSGDFTPFNPLGQYYPNARLSTPIRVTMVLDTGVGRFFGNVTSWGPEWPSGDIADQENQYSGWSRVRVSAAGIWQRIDTANETLGSALFRAIVARQDVVAYWPGEDDSQATQAASPIPGVNPFTPTSVDFAREGNTVPAGSDPRGLIEAPPGSAETWGEVPAASAEKWFISELFYIPDPDAGFLGALTVATDYSQAARWFISVSNSQIRLQALNENLTALFTNTQAVPTSAYGRWWFLWLQIEQDGSGVDWSYGLISADTALETIAGASGTLGSTTLGTITRAGLGPGPAGGSTDRFFGHVVVLSGPTAELSSFDLEAIHGYTGERAGNRFDRLLTEAGIAHSIIGDPNTTEPMGPQRPGTLTGQLDEVEELGGVIYEARDGPELVFRTQGSLYNQSETVLLDASLPQPEIETPFDPVLDTQNFHNDVTVTRVAGSSTRLVDETSVSEFGRYDDSVELNVETDSQTQQHAGWRLHLGTWPAMRYRAITPAVTQALRLLDDWPAVEIGDLIRVEGLPQQHPTQEPVEVLVWGYDEEISPKGYRSVANTRPAGPFHVFQFVDDPAPSPADEGSRSRLWSARGVRDASYLAEDIDEEATTFDVIVPAQRALNPAADFERAFTIGTFGDWFTSNLTDLQRVATERFTGRWSGLMIPTGAATTGTIRGSSPIGTGPPSRIFEASAWVRPVVAGLRARVRLFFVRATPVATVQATASGAQTALTVGQWTRLYVSSSALGATPFPPTGDPTRTNTAMIQLELSRVDAGTLLASNRLHVDDAEVGVPGASWITTADHSAMLPMAIRVAGEVMRVTAIGAPTDAVQQFTVTRAVNGIAKAHVAGERIEQVPRTVWAL